ncbi:MAG: hypothetical protein ACE5HD_03505 [Acidobacteriota bacterium]
MQRSFQRHPLYRRVIERLGVGKIIVLSLAGMIMLLLGLAGMHRHGQENLGILPHITVAPESVRGTLRISCYADNAKVSQQAPLRHLSVFVNGRHYAGMEDNDLRGFLDGVFKYGWNQPGQVHFRAGRRMTAPRYGELELFRSIQRWDHIELPPSTRIVQARLSITVEHGPSTEMPVLLYEVNKDWVPGEGGTHHDNTSPPQQGEVWWNDVAYQERSWGLPGLGFASDSDPDADTKAMPLAEARYRPGEETLEFSSSDLAQYISRRVQQHKPLLLLLKLPDYYEDHLGTGISLESGNHGDNRNIKWRPHLFIEWESPRESQQFQKRMFLEYGRSYVLPSLITEGATFFAASFVPETGYESPTIEMRGHHAGHTSSWRQTPLPIRANWDRLEVRLLAATDPIILGSEFTTDLRDTWVRTKPPEEQEVPWTFVSPSGKSHQVMAKYQGHYRWAVSFRPQELGNWEYFWTQNFTEKPYKSATGRFDVVAGSHENIMKHLHLLRDQILQTDKRSHTELMQAFEPDFIKLERAALQRETPESFASDAGRDLRKLLREIRALLGGQKVPEPEPLPAMNRTW